MRQEIDQDKENDFANEINKALAEGVQDNKEANPGNVVNADFSGSQSEPGSSVDPGDDETRSIWNAKTLEKVNAFAETQADIKDQRKALNDQLAAARSELIAEGFNGDAMEAAIKYSRTDEDKRENFDLTYLYCRKALGQPVQDDLFAAAMREQVTVSRKSKED